MKFKGIGDRKLGIGLNAVLAGSIVIVSMTLIIGRHFEAAWAGGEGYRERSAVTVLVKDGSDGVCSGADASRESIVTCADQRKQAAFGALTLWLDGKTDFAIADYRSGKETFTSHGGRSIIRGPVSIHVGDVTVSTTGLMSLVDYSWLQKAEVYAINGDVSIQRGDESVTVISGTAMSFDTVAPYDAAESIDYAFENSAAADFYVWAKANVAY